MSKGILVALAAAMCAPPAMALDPLYDQVCIDETMCAGPGTCVVAACVPRGCPVLSCRAQLGPDSGDCAKNATIDGRMCAYVVSVGTDAPTNSVGVAAQSSNGSVHGEHLENTWVSPGAEAHARALGLDAGRVHAHAYRSDIQTEGPRGGPFGLVSPGPEHTWTQVGVAAGYSGPFVREDVVVVVELLDLMPEGCFVRSHSPALPDVDCPRVGRYYPWMALP